MNITSLEWDKTKWEVWPSPWGLKSFPLHLTQIKCKNIKRSPQRDEEMLIKTDLDFEIPQQGYTCGIDGKVFEWGWEWEWEWEWDLRTLNGFWELKNDSITYIYTAFLPETVHPSGISLWCVTPYCPSYQHFLQAILQTISCRRTNGWLCLCIQIQIQFIQIWHNTNLIWCR